MQNCGLPFFDTYMFFCVFMDTKIHHIRSEQGPVHLHGDETKVHNKNTETALIMNDKQ